jgi:hypothetical protein
MVAPLKQKPASVEIGQARDEPAQFPIMRCWTVGLTSDRSRPSGQASRASSFGHLRGPATTTVRGGLFPPRSRITAALAIMGADGRADRFVARFSARDPIDRAARPIGAIRDERVPVSPSSGLFSTACARPESPNNDRRAPLNPES